MLSVLCFSLVPVLRCVALRRIEFSTLLIPPGIELLFSITLFIKRHDKGGRYHYLLCAEGTSYFLLALLDFLSRAVTALHQDLVVVKVVDLVIGGLSIVPLLCFTLWFFFTAQEELFWVIPARLRKLTKYALVSCIPLVVVTNATGAFVGVSYRTVEGVITIGFIDERARTLWGVFNKLSLALLAALEVVAFSLLSARLIKAIRHKKQRELMNGTGQIYHFGGIFVMNLGMALSLAETLVGFAPQSFLLAITRRGTKSAGRILIISGLLKGWDYIEDVRFVLQEPPRPKRISKFSIRQFFPSRRNSSNGTQTPGRNRERVLVRHHRGRAPTLHLRLSGFEVSPIMKTFRFSSRSQNSLQTHLVPQMPPTEPLVETTTPGRPGIWRSHYRTSPLDVPISPLTPDSPWATMGSHPGASSSSDHTACPRSPIPNQDAFSHHPSHLRDNTMSSTLSQLQVEVMTLSESPPDPGFVLPIPSRSRIRQNYELSLDDPMLTSSSTYAMRAAEPKYPENLPSNRGASQPRQGMSPYYTSPEDEDFILPPLEPPRPRRTSWVSESSDMSSAIISTATRLVRANTTVSLTSPVTRQTSTTISGREGPSRQRIALDGEHPLSVAPPSNHIDNPETDAV